MKKAVFIIAKTSFRDEEYFEPKAVLTKSGITITTASSTPGPCGGKLGGKANADLAVSSIDISDFGAVYTGKPVESDGTVITADGPQSASLFGSMIAKALKNG